MPLIKSSRLWEIIWEGRKIILAITLVSLALGLFFEKTRGSYWVTTVPLVISPSGEQGSPDFNYEHYYALQASDTLTDSLEEWLKTAPVRGGAQSDSKANFHSSSWSFWEKNGWSVKKKAPQLVEVTFFTGSDREAGLIEKSLKSKVNDFLTSFNQTGKPYFSLTNSSSSVEFQAPRWSIICLASVLWGILLGIIVVLEKENLRSREKTSL
jgi:LPS O-antigen subunit length determinant protein (WzzB/FepE family)